jgi:uncharacterized SAM-binding protein YcdF (DUF218 family)
VYFILSKLLLVIIQPFTWVGVLLLLAVFTKQPIKKQRLLVAACIVLYLFSNSLLINLYARMWDYLPNTSVKKGSSAVILLGGFISEDEDGGGHFNNAADRYIQATKLLNNHTASHLLFTGGNGSLNPSKFKEGKFVLNELRRAGFADSLLLIDSLARNTFENAANSKVLLQKANLKPPYLLVTSAFHMRRAVLIYKKQGINVVPYPSHYIAGKHIYISDLLPGTDAFSTWNTYLKELVGYIVTCLK